MGSTDVRNHKTTDSPDWVGVQSAMEFINPSLQTLLIFSLRSISSKRDESEKLMAKAKGVESQQTNVIEVYCYMLIF